MVVIEQLASFNFIVHLKKYSILLLLVCLMPIGVWAQTSKKTTTSKTTGSKIPVNNSKTTKSSKTNTKGSSKENKEENNDDSAIKEDSKKADKAQADKNVDVPAVVDLHKNRFTPKRLYHNLTTRFNYYYNAKLKMNLALDGIAAANKDDYDKILPLNQYDVESATTSISGDMDEVIKKTSMGITLHSIAVWVPDCYLYLGRAYYYKKEYQNAIDVFQFIQTNYKPKLVKGVVQPEKKNFHKPITDEAMIWLIKSYIQMGKFVEADAIITEVSNRKYFSKVLQDELKILQTEILIKRKDYKSAVKPMLTAISLTKHKKTLRRYNYILAQLYEYANDKNMAIAQYKKVLTLKPNYEMEYNARLKIVELLLKSKNPNISEARGILLSMLTNKKFEEFYDAIYYQLGMIEIGQKNEKQAITYLKQSIIVSTVNTDQKGLSFKRLADVYYNKNQYILARNRYDSTLKYMVVTHEEYDEAKIRKEILTEVVNRIRIIQREDSLQTLARMNPDLLYKKLNKIIAKNAAKAAEDSLNKITKNENNTDNTIKTNTDVGGVFYFYNSGLKGTGYNEFVKKWGKRKLADNWRRSKKDISNNTPDDLSVSKENTNNATTNTDEKNNSELDKMLSNIPTSAEKLDKSNNTIIMAYYELGILYKDKLKNYKKSAETFEKLLDRYPKNKFEVETYYQLYLLYEKLVNYAKSEYYKNLILSDFPKSNFAKIINDPNYLSKINKLNIANSLYETTYNLYSKGNYEKALMGCRAADTMQATHPLKPKYALLEALCIGRTNPNLDYFKVALNKVVSNYPADPVKGKAEDILKAIDHKENFLTEKEKPEPAAAPAPAKEDEVIVSYEYKPSTPHYLLVVFTKIKSKNTAVISNITNFNNESHSIDNYKVKQKLLGPETQMVIIETFDNANKAQAYADELNADNAIFKGLKNEEYNIFIISKANMTILNRTQDVDEYLNFYQEKY